MRIEATKSPNILGPAQDPRAVEILARNIYREFRAGGFSEGDVLALAGELLGLVTRDVRGEPGER